MGFTTGFLGGLTLTYSLLYLSLYLHRTNRSHQHVLLSQQSSLLTSLLDPQSSSSSSSRTTRPSAFAAEDPSSSGKGKQSLSESLKERWNAEVEGMVRRAQETDWMEVRERWERRGVNLWRNMTRD